MNTLWIVGGSVGMFWLVLCIRTYIMAWTSVHLGDPSTKLHKQYSLGRKSLIDPRGIIMVIATAIYIPGGGLGRGQRINTNYHYYKYPLRSLLLIRGSGVGTNILGALIGIILIQIRGLWFVGTEHALDVREIIISGKSLVIYTLWLWSLINIHMMLVHLIPLPISDSMMIITYLFPRVTQIVPHSSYLAGLLGLMIMSIGWISVSLLPFLINLSHSILYIMFVVVSHSIFLHTI